jgi:hypothetical protein
MFITTKQLNRMIISQSGLALTFLLAGFACWTADGEKVAAPPGKEVTPGIFEVGHLGHPRLTESSGLAASRRQAGVFWTHTDGGGPRKSILFAVTREGRSLAEFRVVGAAIEDWEDLAIDDAGHLYIGDLGNNDVKREQLAVYEVDEPDVKGARTLAPVNRGWKLRFPKKPFDCESLFIWQGRGYVISKVFKDKKAEIFRFPMADTKEPLVLERVARLPIESPVTGASLSPDGKRLGVVCQAGAYLFDVDGTIEQAGRAPHRRARFKDEHIEACCFVPEGLLTTSETREMYLFTEAAFGEPR